MEKNEEYSACFHDVEIVNKDNKPLENKNNHEIKYIDNQTDFDFDDFLFRGNHIHTPSVVFRAKNIENFILPNVVTGDYFYIYIMHIMAKLSVLKRKWQHTEYI